MNRSIQKISFFFLFIYCGIAGSAQGQKRIIRLFQKETALPASLSPFVKAGTVFSLNDTIIENMLRERPHEFTLEFNFENKLWRIDLEQNDIFSAGFFVTDGKGKPVPYDRSASLHYKGKIENGAGSFAAVTIMRGTVMAVLADEQGNIDIGPRRDRSATDKQHIIFREHDLTARNPFQCATADLPESSSPIPSFSTSTTAVLNAEPVDIYFEADYQCYQNNSGSISNTVNWASAVFNMITAFYANDSIAVRMSGIKVWNIPDPYISASNMGSALTLFTQQMTNGFPGDVAHLLSQRGLGGGIANINILCSTTASSRTSLTGNLSNSVTPLPAYSWNGWRFPMSSVIILLLIIRNGVAGRVVLLITATPPKVPVPPDLRP